MTGILDIYEKKFLYFGLYHEFVQDYAQYFVVELLMIKDRLVKLAKGQIRDSPGQDRFLLGSALKPAAHGDFTVSARLVECIC